MITFRMNQLPSDDKENTIFVCSLCMACAPERAARLTRVPPPLRRRVAHSFLDRETEALMPVSSPA